MSIKRAVFLFIGFLFLFSCSSVNKGFDKRKYTKMSTLKIDYFNQKINTIQKPKINISKHIEKKSVLQTSESFDRDTVSIIETKAVRKELIQGSVKKVALKKTVKIDHKKKRVVKDEFKQNSKSKPKEYNLLLLVLLSFLFPFLAVGLKTNWDLVKVIIALILWPTIFIAIIYSLLIVYDVLEF